MSEFIIRPHGRLQDWVADEQGYFREEGLSYQLVGDEERENRAKDVDPVTGALRDQRSGAFEMYEQGAGSKGATHSDVSCACHWTVNEAAAKKSGRMWGNAYSIMPAAVHPRKSWPFRICVAETEMPVDPDRYATITSRDESS